MRYLGVLTRNKGTTCSGCSARHTRSLLLPTYCAQTHTCDYSNFAGVQLNLTLTSARNVSSPQSIVRCFVMWAKSLSTSNTPVPGVMTTEILPVRSKFRSIKYFSKATKQTASFRYENKNVLFTPIYTCKKQ